MKKFLGSNWVMHAVNISLILAFTSELRLSVFIEVEDPKLLFV